MKGSKANHGYGQRIVGSPHHLLDEVTVTAKSLGSVCKAPEVKKADVRLSASQHHVMF